MSKSKKRRLHPMQCQPDVPGMKLGTYLQTIEFYGKIQRPRKKATDAEVAHLMKLAGIKPL